ncbi:hydroxyacylglutathione hydrolase [Solirhodobacter olei]|uniref:hydroxyacylglutathione hydrolase n=1 Tax=Solirhodobacter olei TaxID=2493082 RepID=UPI000FDC7921|nr:hydroxyacylglutathione hydrolase [Solirhodobacter olei]
MPLTIVTVPCLKDNYAFLLHDAATGAVAVVDVPEVGPIAAELKARGWSLSDILITHHHDDHIQGVAELVAATGAKVTGAAADAHRLPPLDRAVAEGDRVTVGSEAGEVIDVSGHTLGHIAFHFPASQAVFTADSLMALGCGRLFEGSPEVMWQSLSKLAALPPGTTVCSGHEYTASNAKFALTIDPQNAALISRAERVAAARERGEPTVPSTLAEELATNPFLRAGRAEIKAGLGLDGASDAESFAEIRRRKDRF